MSTQPNIILYPNWRIIATLRGDKLLRIASVVMVSDKTAWSDENLTAYRQTLGNVKLAAVTHKYFSTQANACVISDYFNEDLMLNLYPFAGGQAPGTLDNAITPNTRTITQMSTSRSQ